LGEIIAELDDLLSDSSNFMDDNKIEDCNSANNNNFDENRDAKLLFHRRKLGGAPDLKGEGLLKSF